MPPASKLIPPPPVGETLIRMYRQGLGDCFLLTFRGDAGDAVHVLIDCGVWDGDKATLDQMQKVVENIRDATGNRLNLLICTHEHWDHNSGFNQHRALFDTMKIDQVWLAWTENLKDSLAQQLKTEFEARRKKLAAAIKRLSAVKPWLGARAKELVSVEGMMGAAGVRADPADAMGWIRKLANQHPDPFLMPGEVRGIPGAANAARAYVLGPPYSRTPLTRDRPTKKQQKEGVVYHDGDAFHLRFANRLADDAFFAAVDQFGKPTEHLESLIGEALVDYQLGLPFDVARQVAPRQAKKRGSAAAAAGYFTPQQKWRRIDDDWLNTAAQIALWMAGGTNNTSLVLAIELLPAKKVLLMVGDAQVGNWLSWADVKFKPPYAAVTARDLLENTVLYKVGHHGSHNATLRTDGLERMISDDLVAMIPVNRKSVDAKGWAMPYPPMYRALRDRTKGRIIRADEGSAAKPASTSQADWNLFQGKLTPDPVFFQYRCRHN